jgi:fermentation-respiration switch protein FrsA (DUF1100 family)
MHVFAGNDVFDTVGVIRKLQVPLLILHGADDETCPSWMAQKIFNACAAPKRIHTVEGGMHKDLFIRDPDTLIWVLSQFIAELPHGTRTVSVEETPPIEEWMNSALRTMRKVLRKRAPQHA